MDESSILIYLVTTLPSLKIFVPEIYEDAYDYAVLNAAKETGLHRSVFPAQCPWTFDQATDEGFWP